VRKKVREKENELRRKGVRRKVSEEERG